jgi:peptidoglycan/LPS O-acetylase OafA/YrhL
MGRYNVPRIADGAVMSRRLAVQAEVARALDAVEPVSGWSEGRDTGRSSMLTLEDMLAPERNSFGVVRLVLALAVLISHAVWLTTGRHEMEPVFGWTGYTLGQHGVQVFFVLSGILVAQSIARSQSLADYAAARALRIFPALIVCVLATAFLLGPFVTQLPVGNYLSDPGVVAYVVKTISLATGSATLPGVFAGLPAPGAVNTSLWTLKYEVLCYAILAAAGAVAILTQAWRTVTIAGFALWAVAVLAAPVGLELGSSSSGLHTLRYFMLFFGVGVLAYALRSYIIVHGAMVLALAFMFVGAIGSRFEEAAAAVFLGYAALWVATLKFGRLRAYANANDYSYGTYIYSMPVTQVLVMAIPGMSIFALVPLATAITLVIAYLSWEFIERPALTRRHDLADAMRRAFGDAGAWAKGRRRPI